MLFRSAFLWLSDGLFLGAEKLLFFEIYFGLLCGKGGANLFWEWRTEVPMDLDSSLPGSAFVAVIGDDA